MLPCTMIEVSLCHFAYRPSVLIHWRFIASCFNSLSGGPANDPTVSPNIVQYWPVGIRKGLPMDEAQLEARAQELLEISDWHTLSDQEIADQFGIPEPPEAVLIKAKAHRLMAVRLMASVL